MDMLAIYAFKSDLQQALRDQFQPLPHTLIVASVLDSCQLEL